MIGLNKKWTIMPFIQNNNNEHLNSVGKE
jgi:hypothetical protein